MAKQQASTVEEAPVVENTPPVEDNSVAEPQLSEEIPGRKLFQPPYLVSRVGMVASTIWRANIGAAILIEQNTRNLFNRLVEEGTNYQNYGHRDEIDENGNSNESSSIFGGRTIDRFHKIENKIDKGVNNTLHWIGMPSRNDIREMSAKVDDLSDSLTVLTQRLKETLGSETEVH